MPSSRDPHPSVSARTWGALAVLGVVLAFSLSSTLVKRAESPGVLLAFWRLIVVSLIWNAYLWSTGRRVTMRHIRQALIPGLSLRAEPRRVLLRSDPQQRRERGAHRVALAVPHRPARRQALQRGYFDPRALGFALVAFGGVALVLFNAPPNGDASLHGNLFGLLAM